MATITRPELLLLDEHTAALDPRAEEQVMRVTENLTRTHSLTTLMVTHSMEQAVRFGDRTMMMHRGLVVADLSGDERRGVTEADLLLRFAELRNTAEMRFTRELSIAKPPA
jgi:putative ABC transport system ATP-binding protein